MNLLLINKHDTFDNNSVSDNNNFIPDDIQSLLENNFITDFDFDFKDGNNHILGGGFTSDNSLSDKNFIVEEDFIAKDNLIYNNNFKNNSISNNNLIVNCYR